MSSRFRSYDLASLRAPAVGAMVGAIASLACSGNESGNYSPTGGMSGIAGGAAGGAAPISGAPPAGGSGAPTGGSSDQGSGGAATGTSGQSGGGSIGAAGSAAGATGEAGSPSAQWGIETRPSNQTCLPPPSRADAAMLLSKTGCVDPINPKKPAAGLIPYEIASPLWSDNADKRRYFALPDGKTISVKDCQRDPSACEPSSPAYNQDEGEWDFPDGTVLVKSFGFGDHLVETRLLVRVNASTWWGFSYEWRADQSDADLLAANIDGYEREIQTPQGKQVWHFPSRSQCLVCHTEVSGRVLGPETAQMNMDLAYPNGVKGNQLTTLVHAGFFEVGKEPRPLEVFAHPADTTKSIEGRARSYMHANCAMCHRPGAESATSIDLRFDTPLADAQLCNVMPEKGTLGVEGAQRLVPGAPEKSVLSLRMHSLVLDTRMPRIGTRVVDTTGVTAVDNWIRSLTACP